MDYSSNGNSPETGRLEKLPINAEQKKVRDEVRLKLAKLLANLDKEIGEEEWSLIFLDKLNIVDESLSILGDEKKLGLIEKAKYDQFKQKLKSLKTDVENILATDSMKRERLIGELKTLMADILLEVMDKKEEKTIEKVQEDKEEEPQRVPPPYQDLRGY